MQLEEIKTKTFKAVPWLSAGLVLKVLVQLLQITVLARLLTPEDYGLLAMALIFISFVSLFSELGMLPAYIQSSEIKEGQIGDIFWLMLIISLVFYSTMHLSSGGLAILMGEQRLESILKIASISLILNAFSSPMKMVAEKKIEFSKVIFAELTAIILCLILSICLALYGYGVWSLVIGYIVRDGFQAILLWVLLWKGPFPKFKLKLTQLNNLIKFGGVVTFNSVISHFNRISDVFFSGLVLGASELGKYSVARNLNLQVQDTINPLVTRISLPAIAASNRSDTGISDVYRGTLAVVSFVNAPIYILLGVHSDLMVSLLLGDQWSESTQIFALLAVWGAIRSICNPVGSLLIGSGRPKTLLYWNLVILCCYPIIILYAAQFGVVNVAWALVLVQVILYLPAYYFLIKPCTDISLYEYLNITLTPFVFATILFLSIENVTSSFGLTYEIVGIGFAGVIYLTLIQYLYTRIDLRQLFARFFDPKS